MLPKVPILSIAINEPYSTSPSYQYAPSTHPINPPYQLHNPPYQPTLSPNPPTHPINPDVTLATIGRDHVDSAVGVGALPCRAECRDVGVLSGGEWIYSFHKGH